MAIRPVFIVNNQNPFYEERSIEFQFYNGFSETQKHKSIDSLHTAFLRDNPSGTILEVSTKSTNPIGVALSAFNLPVRVSSGTEYRLECVFQGSKVFEHGGPYLDLLPLMPWVVKKDSRLKESGNLIAFRLDGTEFPLEPKTFFYDWLYVNAVSQNANLRESILRYKAFTDIEFNPQKSINCQARSAAIFVSLSTAGLLDSALACPEDFCRIVYGKQFPSEGRQLSLF